jgi:hypothetical protein
MPRNIGFNEDRPEIDRPGKCPETAAQKHGIHAFKNPKQYRLTSCICDELTMLDFWHAGRARVAIAANEGWVSLTTCWAEVAPFLVEKS